MARRHNTVRDGSSGARRVLSVPGDSAPVEVPPQDQTPEEKAAAAGWIKGMLLDVRNAGAYYNVTLQGEEYDPQHPERCLQFTQPNELQSFVSAWYAPDAGPRPPWA